MMNGARLLGACIPHPTTEHSSERPATKELRKDVFGIHATSAGTTFQAFLTIFVIELSFVRIGQDFVGMRNLLKLLGSFGVILVLVCRTTVSKWCTPHGPVCGYSYQGDALEPPSCKQSVFAIRWHQGSTTGKS